MQITGLNEYLMKGIQVVIGLDYKTAITEQIKECKSNDMVAMARLITALQALDNSTDGTIEVSDNVKQVIDAAVMANQKLFPIWVQMQLFEKLEITLPEDKEDA